MKTYNLASYVTGLSVTRQKSVGNHPTTVFSLRGGDDQHQPYVAVNLDLFHSFEPPPVGSRTNELDR